MSYTTFFLADGPSPKWTSTVGYGETDERSRAVRPLSAGQDASEGRAGGSGNRGAREGEAARAGQGFDPGGARDRVLPHPPLRRGSDGVPGDARARSERRLRALCSRPLPREAGPRP